MNEKVLLSREKRSLVAEGSPRLLTQRRCCENGADLGAVEQSDREKPVTNEATTLLGLSGFMNQQFLTTTTPFSLFR